MKTLPTDLDLARQHACDLEQQAREIKDAALMAGAFPQDFRVVHVVRRPGPWTTELR